MVLLDKHAHGKYTELEAKLNAMIREATASNKAELQNLNKITLVKELNKNLKKVLNVRTILSPGASQNLLDFYFPLNVLDAQNNEIDVSSIYSFSNQGPALILGTVGQGKSIFLRYMSFHELCKGKSIPIFLELRKLRSSTPLFSHVSNRLRDLGFTISDKLLTFLLSKGFVSVFLDGFDELSFEVREKWSQEIESVQARFSNCKILITTRPDTEVHQHFSFNVYRLKDLEKGDYPDFIRRVVEGEDDQSSLIKKVNDAGMEIKGVIKTPLMMTLFISVYQSRRKLPRTYSEFFDELFSTILSRHDGLKAAYDRPSKTGLSDKNLKMGLEAFSYQSRKNDKNHFSESELVGLVEASLGILGEDWKGVDATSFIFDIKNITCLLQKEGAEYHFIHDSIQNYYAASFVKSQEENKSEFYSRYLDNWHHWSPEINFLRHIDLYAFNKYFFIPSVEKYFEVSGEAVKKIKLAGFMQAMEEAHLFIMKSKNKHFFSKVVSGERSSNWAINEFCGFPMTRSGGVFEDCITDSLIGTGIVSEDNFKLWIESGKFSPANFEGGGRYIFFKILDYLLEENLTRELYGKISEKCVSDVDKSYRSAKRYIDNKDRMVGVF